MKIWFKINDPTTIISTGKSVGSPDENYIESNVIPEDDEFYEIQGGVVIRKDQAVIDAILAARAQTIADREAAIQKKINDIAVNLPSWSQIDAAIDSADTLAKLRAIVKKMARVLYWLAKDSEA